MEFKWLMIAIAIVCIAISGAVTIVKTSKYGVLESCITSGYEPEVCKKFARTS